MSVASYLRNFLIFLTLCLSAGIALAQQADRQGELVRARLSSQDATQVESSKVLVKLVELDNSASLSVVTRESWLSKSEFMIKDVKDIHATLSGRFGAIPQFSTTIRMMDEDAFFLATNAPRWTSALFYRGTIIIPIPVVSKPSDTENLRRSIRHEYTHSAIHSLTGGNCPGWLDEGLAQILEGETLAQIPAVLDIWLSKNAPIPLSKLQRGFTKLPVSTVPAAYAQSISAVKLLEEISGDRGILSYFNALRSGEDPQAFENSFRISEAAFEKKLRCSLNVPECRFNPELCESRCQLHTDNRDEESRTILANDDESSSEQYLAKVAF